METNSVGSVSASGSNSFWNGFVGRIVAGLIRELPILGLFGLLAVAGCDDQTTPSFPDGGIYPTTPDGGTDGAPDGQVEADGSPADGDTSIILPQTDSGVPVLPDTVWEENAVVTLAGGSHLVEARNIVFEGHLHLQDLHTLTDLGLEIGTDPCPSPDACLPGLESAPETCFDGMINQTPAAESPSACAETGYEYFYACPSLAEGRPAMYLERLHMEAFDANGVLISTIDQIYTPDPELIYGMDDPRVSVDGVTLLGTTCQPGEGLPYYPASFVDFSDNWYADDTLRYRISIDLLLDARMPDEWVNYQTNLTARFIRQGGSE
jgi:hypothetical protein